MDTIKARVIARLKHCGSSLDYPLAHYEADLALCDFLEAMGFRDVVDAYSEVGKMYGGDLEDE